MPPLNLQTVFQDSAAAGVNLFAERYREPSITAYNRLEPRARTEDFSRSLRAEVRDALWMLTRQWQMGELEAEDAGSAIDARLLTSQIHLDRVKFESAAVQHYDENIPMETMVERETIPFTHALKVQIAHFFLKLHPPALRDKYIGDYREAFKFAQDRESEFRGQVNGLNLYIATKGRDFDGEDLLKAIRAENLGTKVAIDLADRPAVMKAAELLRKWFERQYSQPAEGSKTAWDPKRLIYRFRTAAPLSAEGQMVLAADRYQEGRLDWYSFEAEPDAAPIPTDNPAPVLPPPVEPPMSFLPTAATFKGMPNPRFWEMEDRQVNFGKLNAKTTDHLLLVFAEMGLVYGNDWFVIPYLMSVNTLCEIKGLVITDVFGDRTLVRAADDGEDNDWQRWSMFNLSDKGEMGRYNRQFLLPATLTSALEGEPLEQVNFMRDEMANMVWAVEERIPDATGVGINGHEAADRTGVEPPLIVGSPANIRYLLGTTVPENWIPFLPVHIAGSNQDIVFQRAAMPKLDGSPDQVVKAKGVLLKEASPYFVNEEEVPAAGSLVKRSYQRARWYGGRTFLWIGRQRETGRGQGSSNLRFDQIEPLKS
jgi:hypothetical protein